MGGKLVVEAPGKPDGLDVGERGLAESEAAAVVALEEECVETGPAIDVVVGVEGSCRGRRYLAVLAPWTVSVATLREIEFVGL